MAQISKKKQAQEKRWVTRSGTVITEEIAEQMAEEMETRDFDPSTWKRQYVGRPSLGSTGVSPRIGFRASPELHKAAQARAAEEGRSLSDLAREALTRYMNS